MDNQHANTNGYDVQNKDNKIIAEVKCNIPVEEKSFGVAQKTAIKKDLDGLRFGKTKSRDINISEYYKFMVMQDLPNVREAMQKLYGEDCVELTNKNINKEQIYIVYIKI
ncbi:MAG: hypothetical protein IJ180_11435 [Bacteroidales bacterium]|nr:hypothetical protein [Bacteroidales bacterium]MBQ9255369.1 hypothetical protein [Bacteroidales bacterium]